jgi:diguanylate cyclase
MLRLDPATLRKALEQLQQATHDHAEWQENLLRAIVGGVSRDPSDLAEGARAGCRFDRCYYERAPVELWGQPAYAAMGAEHDRLHRIAERLLREMAGDAPIVVDDFADLLAGSGQLRLKLESLKQEIRGVWRNWDAPTGAYGRAGMLPELRAWGELAKQRVQPCCIVLMDLDHFEEINDTQGRTVGDEVLAGAVRFLTRRLRPYDKVFRYVGDEFLISMPGTDLEIGQTVIKRVREGLATQRLVGGPGATALQVTASFGLALLDPGASLEESIERADQALLLAKTAGRNRAISWDPNVITGTRLPRLQIEDAKG